MKSYKENLSKEQILNIISDYEKTKNQTKVAQKHKISPKTVVKICEDNNVSIRRISKKTNCKNCGGTLPQKSKFCPYCGKEIRTELDYAIDNVAAFIKINGTIDVQKDWKIILSRLIMEENQ